MKSRTCVVEPGGESAEGVNSIELQGLNAWDAIGVKRCKAGRISHVEEGKVLLVLTWLDVWVLAYKAVILRFNSNASSVTGFVSGFTREITVVRECTLRSKLGFGARACLDAFT